MTKKFQSSKLYDGFSTVFRQWKAEDTHCKYLHGYAVSFKVTFEGDLDYRNWVYDFGGLKRSQTTIKGVNSMRAKEWLEYTFDHTTVITEDDPYLENFKELDRLGVIQLRVLPYVGAERFAEYLFEKLNDFVQTDTNGRVKVKRVDFYENPRNGASYEER